MKIVDKTIYKLVDEQPTEVVEQIVKWLKGRLNGCKAIIGISGGKDSTVAAALCARALGKENVIGIMMPNGEQSDITDSHMICNELGIYNSVVNIEQMADATVNTIKDFLNNGNGEDLTKEDKQALFNIPPRLRMSVLYAIAATFPNGRVINTSNASEAYVGWCTKWGDNTGDIAPLACFTKSQVVKLGLAMPEIPECLVTKLPADGLTGKSDEDNLGFTYEELDAYIEKGIEGPNIDKIRKLHFQSNHKREHIPAFNLYSPK